MTLRLSYGDDVPYLLRGASTKPEISSLYFQRVQFDQKEAAALFTLMKINRQWTHVSFDDCCNKKRIINATTTTTTTTTNITTNTATDNDTAVTDLDVPIATFMFNDNVKKLSFIQQFCPRTSVAVNAALHFTQCLETVRIINATLTMESMQPLADALADNCRLKELDLQSSQISSSNDDDDDGNDATAVKVLARGLRGNKNLKLLSIKNCNLTDDNVRDLVQSLAHNASLEELDLGYNKCSSATLVWVTFLLQSSTCKLTRLSLENQDLGESSSLSLDITALATALETNEDLKHLDLSGNRLNNHDFEMLANALRRNTTLETLHLWDNQLTDRGAKTFSEAIPGCQGLKRLYLGENKFGKEGSRYMLQALELNDALQYVALPSFTWVREMAV